MAEKTHAHKGDLIEIHGHKVGETARAGEILEVLGTGEHEHYRVRWEDGHESIFTPGSDAVVVRHTVKEAPDG